MQILVARSHYPGTGICKSPAPFTPYILLHNHCAEGVRQAKGGDPKRQTRDRGGNPF